MQLEAADRERAREAAQQAREKIDAKARVAAKARVEAAKALTQALRGYADAYAKWLHVNEDMAGVMTVAPHLHDVFGTSAKEDAARELMRLSWNVPVQMIPPGAAIRALATGDDIKPLVDQCEADAKALFQA
ncbi:MAG: hypothetical protein WDM85_07760 [Caulobacteraceae bacterium]